MLLYFGTYSTFVAALRNGGSYFRGVFQRIGLKNMNFLFSYFDDGKLIDTLDIDQWDYGKIFLDCGAFAAFSRGTEISLDDYALFCLENFEKLDLIASLDVMPREFKVSTIEAAERSKKNFEEMCDFFLKEGLELTKLVPVFHRGEPFDYLRFYLDSPVDIVALGAIASSKVKETRRRWLDKCWEMILGSDKKVHGFGITDFELLLTYPWDSVDSVSWLGNKFGVMFVPEVLGRKKYNFLKLNRLLVGRFKESKKRFFVKQEEMLINEYLSLFGLSLDVVREKWFLLNLVCFCFFCFFMKQLNEEKEFLEFS